MANLLNQNIGTNYKGILNLNTLNGNLSGTLQAVTDGDGNASPLTLSTGEVGISRTIALGAGATNVRLINETYTINNSGAQTGTATGIFLNATETALNGMTHNLMDLQRGGISQFLVSRVGAVTIVGDFITSSTGGQLRISDTKLGRGGADGTFVMLNNAENGFNRLMLGGTTNAFPAIKRNGAAIEFRLADDSGFCNFNAANTILKGSTTNSSAIALLVTDSADLLLLRARNDGQIQLGNSSNFTIEGGTGTTFNRFELVVGALSSVPSAILSATSTTRGFLPPRMTTTQVNAISSPAAGLVVYSTTENQLCLYNGSSWRKLNDSPL